MKLIFVPILLVVFGNAFFTEADINRKRLNKEIENRFQLTGYDLRKMEFTSDSPRETENGIFWKIENKIETVGFVYTGRVFSCGKNGCSEGQAVTAGEIAEDYRVAHDWLVAGG